LDGRLATTRRVLTDAPANQLMERLAERLGNEYGLTAVELLLVDYRLAALVALQGGRADADCDGPAWGCFDRQAEVDTEDAYFLPVTVRGDRLGVLRLSPRPTDRATRAELAETATLLAHEIVAARGATDRYLVAARTQRLTLAAEMQWELLPGRSCLRPAFSLAGQLEPAYAVRGDSFDWADDADRLFLSALNGMGEGVAAATLTALATYSLRNARRAGLPLVDQAGLADEAVYAYHRGTQYVSALLIELELTTGRLSLVDAGSPLLLLQRGDEVIDQRLEAQLPLGMFDGTRYQLQEFQLQPGDRLFLLSDGVFEAISGETRYGEAALKQFIRDTRNLAPLDAVRGLLSDLRTHVGGDLIDDAVAVCLDWSGL
jgi:serine phosphatase RsbU (regulator of sigma subunit)